MFKLKFYSNTILEKIIILNSCISRNLISNIESTVIRFMQRKIHKKAPIVQDPSHARFLKRVDISTDVLSCDTKKNYYKSVGIGLKGWSKIQTRKSNNYFFRKKCYTLGKCTIVGPSWESHILSPFQFYIILQPYQLL